MGCSNNFFKLTKKLFHFYVNFKGKFLKFDKNIGITGIVNDVKHLLATTSKTGPLQVACSFTHIHHCGIFTIRWVVKSHAPGEGRI